MADKILIGLDRDGTIIEDALYLGKEDNWREQIKFCNVATEGLKKLRADPRIRLVVTTNQAGVARGFFSEERAKETNFEFRRLLESRGIKLDGLYFCPYVDKEYAKAKGIPSDSQHVMENDMRKPGIGMLKIAVKDLGLEMSDFIAIYYIGDKPSDVQTGINAGGKGILLTNKKGERYDKTKSIMADNSGKVFFAKNLAEAADIILKDIK